MLCTVISQVFSARGPLESESSLDHAAAQLVESHVRGLVGFGYNGVVGESHRSGIIGLDGILPLGPFHVYESLEQRYHVLVSDKKAASSAAAAEDMTNLIIWAMARMGPF